MATEIELAFGTKQDLIAFSNRIKMMVPGGSKLRDNEAMALAQVSMVTQLNPYIGEVWYIPDKGPMVGIRGARRYANEQVKQEGGSDAYWFPEIVPCDPSEAGASKDEDVVAAFKCIIHDSAATLKFQRAFKELVETMRASGSSDPVGEARSILGPTPSWVGYGYATSKEQTRMNKTAAARKRAEADAIKKRFYIPFGAGVSEMDSSNEIIEAEPVTSSTTALEQKVENAEVVKAKVFSLAMENQKKNKLSATQAQRGLVAGVLNECFAGDKDSDKIRHTVMKYLTGYDTTGGNGMPGMYVLALLDWLKPEKDSGGAYKPSPEAVREANMVWTQALKDAGQLEMEV